MKNSMHQLMIEQLDDKLQLYQPLLGINRPERGWLHAIRKAYRMSFRQFGQRLGITPPSAEHIEKREREGSITLKSLEEAGKALNMKLVYGFVPIDGSLQCSIELRAKELAREIVVSTSNTMALEDQQNSQQRIEKAIEEKARQIIYEMPRYLWG